jgi:serine/threonine protein kinase
VQEDNKTTVRDTDATRVRGVDEIRTVLTPVDSDKTEIRSPGELQEIAANNTEAFGREGELQPGDVIKDRFEIVKVLGRGGMGVVYKAIDRRKVEAQDRDPYVALKALSRQWRANERMVIALQREARKAQTLAHPNIATVYDFDRDGEMVYITMEQLSGAPMDDFIRDHPKGISRQQAAPIIRGICLALAYAHNKGIVHSDFKPGNVFLNNGTNPKVLDFGIARAAPVSGNVEASDQTTFDAGELGALTPSYAALEMFKGEPPHPADDVYALAVTTYQLLTGRHPFDNLPAPQARSAARRPEFIRGLKRREWQAIRRGLEFNRADRIGHAEEFLRVFEGPKRARVAIAASAVLAILLAGYSAFDQIQERARVSPDVPWAELPLDVRTAFEEHIKNGDNAWRYNDAAGAILSWREAYDLHPRNPDATRLLVKGFTSMAERAIASNDPEVRSSVALNLASLMETDGYLRTHPELKRLNDQLQEAR